MQCRDIAYGQEQSKDIRVSDVLEDVLEETEGFDANVEDLSSEELNRVWSKIQNRLVSVGVVDKLEEGFVENKNKVFLPAKIIAINDPNIINYQFVKVYETKNGETENYIDYTEYNSIRTRDFNFNGASFACSVAGVIACTSYCAFWGIA